MQKTKDNGVTIGETRYSDIIDFIAAYQRLTRFMRHYTAFPVNLDYFYGVVCGKLGTGKLEGMNTEWNYGYNDYINGELYGVLDVCDAPLNELEVIAEKYLRFVSYL